MKKRKPGSFDPFEPSASIQNQLRQSTQTAERRRYNDHICRLWDELSDFGLGATNDALTHCMRTICTWIGAQNAFWIGAVRMAHENGMSRDPVFGWRIGAIEVLDAERTSRERMSIGTKVLHTDDPGDTTRSVVSGAGQFRVYSLGTGLVDLDAFKKTAHYDHFYRQPGIRDRIWAVFPINDDVESYFLFDRYGEDSHFSACDLRLTAETLRGIKWFHRQLLLNRGLGISNAPLTPADRRVIPELLSGADEKTIAVRLNLAKATVHQYVTTVYRKFGVRGRAEFMSLWLRGRL